MTDATTTEMRTYGNWVRPRTPGLFRLGMLGTAGLLGTAVLALVVQAVAGLTAGLVIGVIGLTAIAPLAFRSRTGRNGWQTLAAFVAFTRARRQGTTTFAPDLAAGRTGLLLDGPAALPGLMSRLSCVPARDDRGAEFAVLDWSGTAQHHSVLLRVRPEGAQLVDSSTVDVWVARWGTWLAGLADEPGLVGASVTVETAPDPGFGVSAEVRRILSPGAPGFARAMLEETARTYPRGGAAVNAWIALTWTARGDAGRRQSRDDLIAHVASRLPGLVDGLRGTGAGAVTPMRASEVAERIRTAWDPGSAEVFARLRGDGVDPDLAWSQLATPATEHSGYVEHAEHTSTTYLMRSAPASPVPATVLTPLLRPHRAVARKRVTVLYRVHSSESAARIADEDLRTAAGFAKGRKGEARAEDTTALRAARQTAQEQAQGAGLVQFAVVVTATMPSGSDIRRTDSLVEQLGSAARLRLRPATYVQATSFQIGLGVGLVARAHSAVPALIRDTL